jgi:hypothetical protein
MRHSLHTIDPQARQLCFHVNAPNAFLHVLHLLVVEWSNHLSLATPSMGTGRLRKLSRVGAAIIITPPEYPQAPGGSDPYLPKDESEFQQFRTRLLIVSQNTNHTTQRKARNEIHSHSHDVRALLTADCGGFFNSGAEATRSFWDRQQCHIPVETQANPLDYISPWGFKFMSCKTSTERNSACLQQRPLQLLTLLCRWDTLSQS